MMTITQEWLDRKRPKTPSEADEFDEKYKDKLGWKLEKKDRARAIMDQKATSVADIAAVLAIQEDEVKNGFGEERPPAPGSRRRRQRQANAQKKNEAFVKEAAERVARWEKSISDSTREYKVELPQSELTGDRVKLVWADIQDARFAQSWPERVRHAEMDMSRDHVMMARGESFYSKDTIASEEFKEKAPEVSKEVEAREESKDTNAL